MKLSDERLAEMEVEARNYLRDEWGSVIRELRDYRKAVREYIDAVDAERTTPRKDDHGKTSIRLADATWKAEATLRALKERT